MRYFVFTVGFFVMILSFQNFSFIKYRREFCCLPWHEGNENRTRAVVKFAEDKFMDPIVILQQVRILGSERHDWSNKQSDMRKIRKSSLLIQRFEIESLFPILVQKSPLDTFCILSDQVLITLSSIVSPFFYLRRRVYFISEIKDCSFDRFIQRLTMLKTIN